jgi:O-methyltransferase
MEAQYHASVDGNLLSKVNLLRFIRAFHFSHEMPPGYFMEFGVLNGQGMVQVYSQLRGKLTHLYGFDTFAGLPGLSPDDEAANALMPQFHAGNFASLQPRAVKDFIIGATSGLDDGKLTFVQGAFSDTLPSFDPAQLADKGPCLLANVDCDLYSSSKDVFAFLDGVVTTGTWLLLDDYWTYRGSPYHGQRRAFDEWMATSTRVGTTFYSNYNGFSRCYICYEKELASG